MTWSPASAFRAVTGRAPPVAALVARTTTASIGSCGSSPSRGSLTGWYGPWSAWVQLWRTSTHHVVSVWHARRTAPRCTSVGAATDEGEAGEPRGTWVTGSPPRPREHAGASVDDQPPRRFPGAPRALARRLSCVR